MKDSRRSRKGGSLLEFTLVGIPLLFLLSSTFELSRAMWMYHSVDHAVNEGARYAVVHGQGCTTGGNSCSTTVAAVVNQVLSSAPGLVPGNLTLQLISANSTITCRPATACGGNNSVWPPAGDNAAGMDIRVSGQYAFSSALSIFWPGAGRVAFAPINLPAYARQAIQF